MAETRVRERALYPQEAPAPVWPDRYDEPVTVDEFYRLVDEDSSLALVNGVIVVPSPASNPHEALFAFILSTLSSYAAERQLGDVLGSRMSVRIDEYNCREPDILFVRADRRHVITEQEITGAPDLVMEIVSPGDSRPETIAKQVQYEQLGVREFWLIDQPKRRLAVHELGDDGRFRALATEAGVARSQVVPGFYLSENSLWCQPWEHPSPYRVVGEMLAADQGG